MARINKRATDKSGRAKRRDVKVSTTKATVAVRRDQQTTPDGPTDPAAVDRRRQVIGSDDPRGRAND